MSANDRDREAARVLHHGGQIPREDVLRPLLVELLLDAAERGCNDYGVTRAVREVNDGREWQLFRDMPIPRMED